MAPCIFLPGPSQSIESPLLIASVILLSFCRFNRYFCFYCVILLLLCYFVQHFCELLLCFINTFDFTWHAHQERAAAQMHSVSEQPKPFIFNSYSGCIFILMGKRIKS